MLRSTVSSLLAAGLLMAPAAAQADVVVLGTGEPEFTNSANNTQWVQWSNNGAYRVEFNHIVNGVDVATDGPYQVASNGSTSVNWTGIRGVATPLTEGTTYKICGRGRWTDSNGLWFSDALSACDDGARRGLRTATTIDRTKPTISVQAPAVSRTAEVGIDIAYDDALAYPFGVAFTSVDSDTYSELPGCAPADPGKKHTSFACKVTLPVAEGVHRVCAIVPDAAIPDNPSSSDQRGTATSANRSDPKCQDVLLDTTAPTAQISGPDRVEAGQAARYTAAASDAGSGLAAGTGTWTWGAGGSSSSGLDTQHTFAGPGTYEVRVAVADAAGNRTEATKVVTVVPAPAAGGGGGGGTVDPGTVDPTPVPPATPSSPTPQIPSAPSSDLQVRVLGVVRRGGAPRSLTLGVSGANGTALVVLRRGSRIVVTRRVKVKAGKATLPLPRKLVSGVHTVEVVVGQRAAKAKVRLTGRPAKARARKAAPGIDTRGLERKLP